MLGTREGQCVFRLTKESVQIISSDPLCKDGNALFTTVPVKALSDQV